MIWRNTQPKIMTCFSWNNYQVLIIEYSKQGFRYIMGSDSGDPGILDTINSKWFYHKFELNICKPLNWCANTLVWFHFTINLNFGYQKIFLIWTHDVDHPLCPVTNIKIIPEMKKNREWYWNYISRILLIKNSAIAFARILLISGY